MTETAIKRLYVGKDRMVTFICPKCSHVRKESAEQYKDRTGSIKIECKCTNVYEVQLEFRKTFRKETFLDGSYFRAFHPVDWGKMIVRDLSLWGCRFETMKECSLAPGEEIRVEFVLDDHRSSTINKKGVVLNVRGRYVGCRFSVPPGSFDSDLGFYLRNT